MTPRAYKYWPEFAKSVFDERVALMLEANNLPMNGVVPGEIARIAMDQAENEIKLVEERKRK